MAYDYKNIMKYEKSQVNGLTKMLANLRFKTEYESNSQLWDRIFKVAENIGMEIGYSAVNGERLDFKTPRKITASQTALGKTWLKNYFFKANGEPRTGKRTEYVSDRVLNIAKSVSRFEFVGVYVLASSGWYPSSVVPIYRTFNRKGEYFDYSPIHWGEPIIDENN